jgi:hypothetical protein
LIAARIEPPPKAEVWPPQPSARCLRKEPESGCLFRYLPGWRLPAKSPQACWTSRGRFAKRRPLAVAVSGSLFGRIAQLVEQLTLNQRVPGSSPGAPTTQSSGLELRSPLSHLCCRNRGFSYLYASLYSVSASKKGHSRPPSLPPESPFPALSGDRFDDWLVGHQFEPYCLHHAVFGFKTRSSFSHLLRWNGDFPASVAVSAFSLS